MSVPYFILVLISSPYFVPVIISDDGVPVNPEIPAAGEMGGTATFPQLIQANVSLAVMINKAAAASSTAPSSAAASFPEVNATDSNSTETRKLKNNSRRMLMKAQGSESPATKGRTVASDQVINASSRINVRHLIEANASVSSESPGY